MTMAMVSLAGIPPLAGFFGKFLLLKSILAQAQANPSYYFLAFTAVAGVVISMSVERITCFKIGGARNQVSKILMAAMANAI